MHSPSVLPQSPALVGAVALGFLVALLWLAVDPGAAQDAATRPAAGPSLDPNLPTLWVIGDSTVRNNTPGQQGWGDPIRALFDASRINVVNRAIGGRSSRTFITDGRWDQILAEAKPGDFVLIQFGHNDGGPLDDEARARGTIRGTGDESREIYNPIRKQQEVVHTYGWYLRKYVADARAKGMTPIICSPIPRVPRETITTRPAASSYPLHAGEVARSEGAPFIDLHAMLLDRYAGLEPAEIKARYFCEADNTHTSPAGAAFNAGVVVDGIRALDGVKLRDYLAGDAR